MDQKKACRLTGIDVARAIAIFLAMTSHIWTVSKVSTFFTGPGIDLMRVAMQTATPTFIILFGSMLQIIYQPRFDQHRQRDITLRLLTRAVQCWLLYCLSVMMLLLFHRSYTLFFSLSTMLMMGVTPFTDILKFYAVALTLAPALLLAERRFGLQPLLIAALLVHLLHPELRNLAGPGQVGLPKEADRLAMFLFGIGPATLGGPSLLHGMTLVIFGMALGRCLRAAERKTIYLYAIFGASLVILVLGGWFLGPAAIRKLGTMIPRMHSEPLYFAAGLCIASTLTAGAMLVTGRKGYNRTWEKLAFFGRTSLFTFAFGNMLLYLVLTRPVNGAQSIFLATALTSAVTLLSFGFDRAMRKDGLVARAVIAMKRLIVATLRLLFDFVFPAKTPANQHV